MAVQLNRYEWMTIEDLRKKFPEFQSITDSEIQNAITIMAREIDTLCNRRIGHDMNKITETYTESDGTIVDIGTIKHEVIEALSIAVKMRLDNGLQYVQTQTQGSFGDVSMTYNPSEAWEMEIPREVINILEGVGLYGQTIMASSPAPMGMGKGYGHCGNGDPYGRGFQTKLEADQTYAYKTEKAPDEVITPTEAGGKAQLAINEDKMKVLLDKLGFKLNDGRYRGTMTEPLKTIDANELLRMYTIGTGSTGGKLEGIPLIDLLGQPQLYYKGGHEFKVGDTFIVIDVTETPKEYIFDARGIFVQSSGGTGSANVKNVKLLSDAKADKGAIYVVENMGEGSEDGISGHIFRDGERGIVIYGDDLRIPTFIPLDSERVSTAGAISDINPSLASNYDKYIMVDDMEQSMTVDGYQFDVDEKGIVTIDSTGVMRMSPYAGEVWRKLNFLIENNKQLSLLNESNIKGHDQDLDNLELSLTNLTAKVNGDEVAIKLSQEAQDVIIAANKKRSEDNERRLDENDKTTFSITPNSYLGGLQEMLEHYKVPVPTVDRDGATASYPSWKEALAANLVLDTLFNLNDKDWITEQEATTMGWSPAYAAQIAKSAQWARTYIYEEGKKIPDSVGGVKVDMSFRPYASPLGTPPTIAPEHDQLLFKAKTGSKVAQLLLEFLSTVLYQESDKIAELQANLNAVDAINGETLNAGFTVINVQKAAGTAANVKFGNKEPVNQQSGAGLSKLEIKNKHWISDWAVFGDNLKTAQQTLTTPQVVRPAPVDKDGNALPNPAVIPNPNDERFRGSFLTMQNASDMGKLSGDNQLIYKSTELVGLPNQYGWKLMNPKAGVGTETYNLLTDASGAAAVASPTNQWAELNGTTGSREALFCDDDFYYPPRGSGTGDGSSPRNPIVLANEKINGRNTSVWIGHIPLLKSQDVQFKMTTIKASNLTNPHIRVNFVLALAYRSAADKGITDIEVVRQMNLVTDYYFAPTTAKLNALKALDYVESEFANFALKDIIINTSTLSGAPTQITESWNTASYTLPKGIHVYATKNADGDVSLYWAMKNAYDPHGEDGVVAIPVDMRIEVSTSGASATLGAGIKTLDAQVASLSTKVTALDAAKEDKLQRWNTVAEMDADVAPTHANDLGWNNETNKLYRYDAVNNKWVTFDAQSILGTDNTGNDVELEIDNTDPKNPKISGGLSLEYTTKQENTHIAIGNEIVAVDNKAIGLLQDVNDLQDKDVVHDTKIQENKDTITKIGTDVTKLEIDQTTIATEVAKNTTGVADLEKGKQDLHDYSTLATQKEVYDRIIADGLIPETEVILSVGGVKTHAHIVQLDTAAKEFTFMITGDWKAADGTHVTSFKKGLVDGTATTGLPTGDAGIIQAEQFKAKSEATEDKHLIRLKEYKVDKAADKVYKTANDAKQKAQDDIISNVIVETNKVAVQVTDNKDEIVIDKSNIQKNVIAIAGAAAAAAAGLRWLNVEPANDADKKAGDMFPQEVSMVVSGVPTILHALTVWDGTKDVRLIDPSEITNIVAASGRFPTVTHVDGEIHRIDTAMATDKQDLADYKVAMNLVTLPQYTKKTELGATLAARDVTNAANLLLKLDKAVYDAFIIKYGTDKVAEDKALADYKTANDKVITDYKAAMVLEQKAQDKALTDGLKGKVSNTVGGAAIDPLKTYLSKGGELVEYVPPKAFSTFATKVLLDAETGMKSGDLAYVSETHSWYDYDGAAWKNAYTDAEIDAKIKVVADRVKVLEDIRIDDTKLTAAETLRGAW